MISGRFLIDGAFAGLVGLMLVLMFAGLVGEAALLFLPPYALWIAPRLFAAVPAPLMVGASALYAAWIFFYFNGYLWAFFYFAGFLALLALARRAKLPRITAYGVAVFAPYAVSELWELPQVIANFGHLFTYLGGWGAAMNIGFKLLGVPIVFYLLKQAGWHPTRHFGLSILLLAVGTLVLVPFAVHGSSPYVLHLWRLPFLMLFGFVILQTPGIRQVKARTSQHVALYCPIP